LPRIREDLGFSDTSPSWSQNAYTLVFGGLLLLGGRVRDLLGRRRTFVFGIGVFAAASLLADRVSAAYLGAAVLLALAVAITLAARPRRRAPWAPRPRSSARTRPQPSDPIDQEIDMQITRNATETALGPAESFTGTVFIDAIASSTPPSRLGAAAVHFTPGARTAWHTHPFGQTVYVTEGVGRCQREGGPIEVIKPGDRVFFEPGENHWHGAAPDRFMTHIAMQEADDAGSPVAWGEHVSDEDYTAAPPADTEH
jgi:quercetin dioxygenase-like cupin family protein